MIKKMFILLFLILSNLHIYSTSLESKTTFPPLSSFQNHTIVEDSHLVVLDGNDIIEGDNDQLPTPSEIAMQKMMVFSYNKSQNYFDMYPQKVGVNGSLEEEYKNKVRAFYIEDTVARISKQFKAQSHPIQDVAFKPSELKDSRYKLVLNNHSNGYTHYCAEVTKSEQLSSSDVFMRDDFRSARNNNEGAVVVIYGIENKESDYKKSSNSLSFPENQSSVYLVTHLQISKFIDNYYDKRSQECAKTRYLNELEDGSVLDISDLRKVDFKLKRRKKSTIELKSGAKELLDRLA
jgi:hypothetical protein